MPSLILRQPCLIQMFSRGRVTYLVDLDVCHFSRCDGVEVDKKMFESELGEDLFDCTVVVDGDFVSESTEHVKLSYVVAFWHSLIEIELSIFQGDGKDGVGGEARNAAGSSAA